MSKISEIPPTIVLLSGGPDSATLLKVIENKRKAAGGGVINALYIKTDQEADEKEIQAARKLIEDIGGVLEVSDVSDVVNKLGRPVMYHAGAHPARFGNTLVLSLAVSFASSKGYKSVAMGLHKDDATNNFEYSNEYVARFNNLIKSVDQHAPIIELPFAKMTKMEIIKLGNSIGVNYENTWSCTKRHDIHCGWCGACLARHDAFIQNNLVDPTAYERTPDLTENSAPFGR